MRRGQGRTAKVPCGSVSSASRGITYARGSDVRLGSLMM